MHNIALSIMVSYHENKLALKIYDNYCNAVCNNIYMS